MSDKYVRWRNCQEPGSLMFVTTTCLGYTPALLNPRQKERLLSTLAAECQYHGALLHAFCVMDHHLHLVIRAPLMMSMSKFMQSFKRRSASELLDTATPYVRASLLREIKDDRSFWMRSFRGIPIRSERVMWACVKYVHLNPVRAGICACPEEYAWSSAWIFESCLWTESEGVLPERGRGDRHSRLWR